MVAAPTKLVTKLVTNPNIVQIRFLVSSTKYPPIPIDQKEDDPPFAPMQIVVSIYIYPHSVW